LHVDDARGAHGGVGLGDAVGAALVLHACQNRFEAGRFERRGQKRVVHGEVERQFRRLAGNAPGDPQQQGFAFYLVQQFARETRGFETAGNEYRYITRHDCGTLRASF
jgi:hypothetical protein